MAPQQQQGISLIEFASGGMIDDADLDILDIAFCEYDYGGNIDHNILALGVQFQDENGKTYDQYYSAGELTYFIPSYDGAMAVPVADKSKLTDSCNAVKFLQSLIECGGDQIVNILSTGNIKPLAGMKVHVKQQAQPKRQGLIRGGKDPDKEKSILLVTAIVAWPGEKAAPAPGVKAAGKPVTGRPAQTQTAVTGKPGLGGGGKAAAPRTSASPTGKPNGQAGASTVAAGDDDKAVAADVLNSIIADAGGSVTKKDLPKLAFQKAGEKVAEGVMDVKVKTKIMQLIFQDTFLRELAAGGGIAFDGITVSFPG